MTTIERDATAAPSDWNEIRARFAQIFAGSPEIPDAVIRRALVDSTFEHRLLVSRNAPKFLAALFKDPGNARYEVAAAADPAGAPPSNLQLIGSAAKALAAWSATGFSRVEPDVLERRLAACQACPNLMEPKRLLQQIAGAARSGASVCGLCGCPVRRKARLPSEACPAAHPTKPGVTRWDEPRAGA
jgi:hypothetical protein